MKAQERWLRERNRKKRQKLLQEDADVRGFHSWSYHRHFEQYVEYRVLQPNGRTKLVRTYVGKWYRQKLNNRQYIAIRVFYTVMFLLMLFLFGSAAVSAGAGGASRFAAVTGCASVLLLSVMVYELFVNYIFAPRRMTVGDYRCCTRTMKMVAVGLAVSFVANASAVLAHIAMHTGGSREEAGSALKFLVCAGMAFVIFLTERKLVYEEVEQTSSIPEDAVEITADE